VARDAWGDSVRRACFRIHSRDSGFRRKAFARASRGRLAFVARTCNRADLHPVLHCALRLVSRRCAPIDRTTSDPIAPGPDFAVSSAASPDSSRTA
jgi:hypothetical protein